MHEIGPKTFKELRSYVRADMMYIPPPEKFFDLF